MPNLLRVAAVLLLAHRSALAQSPHLEGQVVVDPSRGLLDGSLCTSRFPPRKSLRFLLGEALNLKSVSDSTGRPIEYTGDIDGRIVGESREYVVQQPDTARPLTALCVSYRGAVPVFEANTATSDWKGRITAIQGTLRAAEQTRWYPTLFDSATGRDEQEVTYRVAVSCPTCRAIYLNGARPIRDTAGRFESSVPRQLLLLAGAFDFVETQELTFVAGAAGPAARAAFSRAVRDIGSYFARLLGTPYREKPVLLSFLSISRDRRPGVSDWQFVTWPTIAFAGGITFDSVLVQARGTSVLPVPLWTTLSHEMAHYYFGTVMKPVGPLRWFALESTAEYLSLKVVYAVRGRIAGVARLTELAGAMGSVTLTTLDRIEREDQVSGTYRYQYAPVFLHSLERRVGEDRVIRMLRNLLATPDSARTDFASLARAAEAAGIPRAELTAGWDANQLRDAALVEGRMALAEAGDDPGESANLVRIAASLVNVDTSLAARSAVLTVLQRVVQRDSLLLPAHYQIGKIGALSGLELKAAHASLELYLRYPTPAGSPSHAAAFWRLGMIEERRGRVDRARAAYRLALEKDPSFAAAKEALARLSRAAPGGQLRDLDSARADLVGMGTTGEVIMSDAMGLLRTDVEIESHHAEGERRLLRQVLVDTGAELSWAPAGVLESLGIARVKQIRFQQADGSILTRWVGFAVLYVPEAFTVDEVVFGEPGDQVLLGARTLEGMNLKVDLVGKRLVSAGPMMAALAA